MHQSGNHYYRIVQTVSITQTARKNKGKPDQVQQPRANPSEKIDLIFLWHVSLCLVPPRAKARGY
jgi:hypothetical protein